MTGTEEKNSDISAAISGLARSRGLTVAVAESLTGGALSGELAAAESSSEWYAGAVVAYQSRTKYHVLGVPDGDPVITESAVLQMARGVRELLRTDAAVAVSGAGGPEGQDGQPAGTVWIAVSVGEDTRTEKHLFPGSPEDILARTTTRALTLLRETIERGSV